MHVTVPRHGTLNPAYSPSLCSETLSGAIAGVFCDRAHRRRTRLYVEDARPSETPQPLVPTQLGGALAGFGNDSDFIAAGLELNPVARRNPVRLGKALGQRNLQLAGYFGHFLTLTRILFLSRCATVCSVCSYNKSHGKAHTQSTGTYMDASPESSLFQGFFVLSGPNASAALFSKVLEFGLSR